MAIVSIKMVPGMASSSFIKEGQQLPPGHSHMSRGSTLGTSAQRAELIALTKALQLGKDKKLLIANMFSPSTKKKKKGGVIHCRRKDY